MAKEKEPKEREKEPWENDGLRYSVSLQDKSDPCLYKEFFETNTFAEAKQAADEAAELNQRNTWVFDRKHSCDNSYRKTIGSKEEAVEEKPLPPRRGRKKKIEEPKVEEPRKKTSKDDYFE